MVLHKRTDKSSIGREDVGTAVGAPAPGIRALVSQEMPLPGVDRLMKCQGMAQHAAAFFEDSIFCSPLLPRMLTKPLTVWRCQPVASMISARVTPFGRFISAMTAAFLLLRSSFAPFAAGRAAEPLLVRDLAPLGPGKL